MYYHAVVEQSIEAVDAVYEFKAKLSLYAVLTLSAAIYEAHLFLPDKPQMSAIWTRVGEKMGGQTGATIAKRLDRSMKHIYERGDRRVLASYQENWLLKRPTAHEFIYIVAAKLYGKENPTTCEEPLQGANGCVGVSLH